MLGSHSLALALAAALAACGGDDDDDDGGDGDADADADADTDTDADADADTDADGDADTDADGDADADADGDWLHVQDNHILTADGRPFRGRGANVHDTRGCNACTWFPPAPAEVMRRIDTLVDDWGANFLRLTLESYGAAEGRVHWQTVLDDPDYVSDIETIVDHVGSKPGTYVLLSLWVDPGHSDQGWPTETTRDEWRLLAARFLDAPHVLFGLVNEPQYNFDGAQDAEVWAAMNDTVQAIREVEDAAGARHHVITVQGTGGWARRLDYYVDHPITAGGGDAIAYEVHVYDPTDTFGERFEDPSATLPVVIGEFGPSDIGPMSEDDCRTLMERARALDVPHLAWTFHMRCPPNLLVDHSGGGCGDGMQLEPTAWGTLLMEGLATPW